jgi:hypothetical protein
MVFKILDEFILYCEIVNASYFKSSFDGGLFHFIFDNIMT